jgi:hypothetical protein
MKYSHMTKKKHSGHADKEKTDETSFRSHHDVLFAKPEHVAARMPTKPSKRLLGVDEGLVHFSEDWDSVETNQEIARMFGLDHLDDAHTL